MAFREQEINAQRARRLDSSPIARSLVFHSIRSDSIGISERTWFPTRQLSGDTQHDHKEETNKQQEQQKGGASSNG
jgi:hypothetical protein